MKEFRLGDFFFMNKKTYWSSDSSFNDFFNEKLETEKSVSLAGSTQCFFTPRVADSVRS